MWTSAEPGCASAVAAAVAVMERFDPGKEFAELPFDELQVVRVGMADAVIADSLHDEEFGVPVLPPISHVVIGGMVDAARPPDALPLGMRDELGWVHPIGVPR